MPLHCFQLSIFLSGIKILRDIDKPQRTKLLTVTVRILIEPYTNTILKLTLVDRGGWAYQISPNNVILPQSKVINSFCQVACRAVWSYSWHNRNSKTNWSISWPLALAGPGLALGSHFMWGSAFNAIIVPLFEFYFRLGGWRHAGTELLLLRWISPSYREMLRNKHPHNTQLLESHERMTAEMLCMAWSSRDI